MTKDHIDADDAGQDAARDTGDDTPQDTADDQVVMAVADAEMADDTPEPKPRRRASARGRKILVPAALVALLVASAAFAALVYFTQFRTDRATNAAVAESALKAATDGTVSLLSYSPDSLDADFASAKTHLTGEFLTYYTQFTQDIVTPAAKEKNVNTSAQVARSAVVDVTPDSAEVLVFINQTTTSKENPDGAFTVSSVKVGLTKVDGNWLISSFDPV